MSYQNILREIAPDRPVFDAKYAILSAPVRHVMMMGVIWHLTKERIKEGFNILEIGSWYGASALSWAQGLTQHNGSNGSITCIDSWKPFFNNERPQEEMYVVMEQALGSDVAYNIFLHNISSVPEKIKRQHFRGLTDNVLPLLRDNTFDIVYLNATHTYEALKKDILSCMRLLQEDGIICGSDLHLQMGECDQDYAYANKEKGQTKDPGTGRNFYPGVTVALHELFSEVSCWGGFWAVQKRGNEWKRFSLKAVPIHFPSHFPADAIERAKAHLEDIMPIE